MRGVHASPLLNWIVAVQHKGHLGHMTKATLSIFTPPIPADPSRNWLLRALDRWLDLQHRVADFGLRQD